jgi:hypothetical protein
MDDFFGYNQINILPLDQHKTTFIFPWGTFAYRKLPFGLNNVSATFQRAMYYAFHDIKHIVQPYLDDFLGHSMHCQDHPQHLQVIFSLQCRHYNSRLNQHNCVFCVESGHLLGFTISKHGIHVDPLNIEAIINLPPPSTLCQLQSLQGKKNFLRRFVPNYAELTKGFNQLLKKGVLFVWDDITEKTFDSLNYVLTHTPLLHPPDYNQDYFLYIVASNKTIAMVLVQEDESNKEHVIYYLSRSLTTYKIKYSHVDKLILVVVQAI